MKNINDFLLTKNVTIRDYKDWSKTKDEVSKNKIVNLIHHRFNNRYVKHLKQIDSGFLMMAVACLMIETIESFRQGLKDTKAKGMGLKMFKDFFKKEVMLFPNFNKIYSDFYYNIRCGILHQAETNNAWRILQIGDILDIKEKTINSKEFVNMLEKALNNYIQSLKKTDFNSEIWKNALLKLDDICENCKSKA